MRSLVVSMLSVMFVATPAFAEALRLQIMPTKVTATRVAGGSASGCDQKIIEAARKAGFVVTNAPLTDEEMICREIDCYPKLVSHHNLDVIVAAEIFTDPVSGYDMVQVSIFRRSSPGSVDKKQESCPSCNAERASERVANLAKRALGTDAGGPPSDPIHLIATFKDPPKNGPALKAAGGVLLGLGLASIITGAVVFSFDGKGTCSLANGATVCPETYGSKVPGGALIGVGAAGAIVGAVLIGVGVSRTNANKPVPTVNITPQGASAGVQGRF